MNKRIKKNDTVTWSWGNGEAEGIVETVNSHEMTIQSKGKDITRNGTEEDPAVVIKQNDGTKVLKLSSELN